MIRKLVIPFAVNCVFLGFVVVLSGGAAHAEALVDIPGLLVALVAPFLATLATHGPALSLRAFSCPFDPDAETDELASSRAFFTCFLRYVVAFTVFAVVTGTVMLLGYLAGNDTGMIGRNLAIALLALFYGSVGSILFILPFLAELDRRLSR